MVLIHLTLILVDFLTGLIFAGAWAIAMAAGAVAVLIAAALTGISAFRRWRARR